jgi:TRAP-type C4-dicarboxylate transport system permease small subunit
LDAGSSGVDVGDSGGAGPSPGDPVEGMARVGRTVARVVEAVVVLMFAAVFLAFNYKIVMRYAAGDAVAWADEISIILFIWIVLLANGFVVEDRRQIVFDLIHRKLTRGGQRAVEIARILLVGGIFLYSLPGALDYLRFLWRERTPVLGWRLDLVYACFGLFMVGVLVRMAWQLLVLVRPRRRGLG